MSLDNLVTINRLQKHAATKDSILKLLAAAERNLLDAQVKSIAAENRFDAAYKAIMQCAMAALWAKGYRAPTNVPGHHQTAIQSLPLTIGVATIDVIVLDALRKQRNCVYQSWHAGTSSYFFALPEVSACSRRCPKAVFGVFVPG